LVISKKSFFTNIPLLSISNSRTLLVNILSLVNLIREDSIFFLSMYIHKSLLKVPFVEGGPNNSTISFLFVFNKINFACFLSKKCTPWCFTTLFNVQFEISKNTIIKKILFMNNKYINIYNNLVNLTRNKDLYVGFTNEDTFSDRLIFFLLHFAFFLKIYKNKDNKRLLQDIYDNTFRQLELGIREIGYGDQSINKKMKDYINYFYSIIDKIDNWEDLTVSEKITILKSFIDVSVNISYLVDYFDKYRLNLINNTLNSHIKGVIKIKN
jgi:cytochrome b pre-mRNA-processing protein 3